MRPMTYLSLLILTVIATIGAGLAILDRAALQADLGGREAMFPELRGTADRVSRIEIIESGARLTLARRGDLWRLRELDGMQADFDRVRELIEGVANLDLAEPKTDDPARWPRLHLAPPRKPDTRSRRVILKDAEGRVMADLVAGKRNYSLGRGGGIYVRRTEGERAWLAEGEVPLPDTDVGWLRDRDRILAAIAPAEIRRIEARDGKGTELFTLTRGADGALNLAGMEADERLARGPARRLETALARLRLTDVAPLETGLATPPARRRLIYHVRPGGAEGGESDTRLILEPLAVEGAEPVWLRLAAEGPEGPRLAAWRKKFAGRRFAVAPAAIEILTVERTALTEPADES